MALDESSDPPPRSEPVTAPEPRGWFRRTILGFAGTYAEVLFLSLLVNLLALAVTFFAIVAFDQFGPVFGRYTLVSLLVGVAVALGFGFILKTLRDHLAMSAGSAAVAQIGDRLFQRLLAGRPARGHDEGQTLLATDLDDLRSAMAATPVVAFVDLPFVALFIAAAYVIGGPVAYIPLIAVSALLLVGVILQIPMRSMAKRARDAMRLRNRVGNEALNGLETVRGMGADSEIRHRWGTLAQKLRRADRVMRGIASWNANLVSAVSIFVVVSVVGFGVERLLSGDVSLGGFVAVAMLAAAAMAPLGQLTSVLIARQKGLIARKAIDAYMQAPVERPEGAAFAVQPDIGGAIVFQDVSFRYPDQTGLALDGVSFRIEPGEKVGLIGRMGAGKSAVMRLILGSYEPQGGSVTVGGTDIRRIDPADLRAGFAWVPQEVRLFDGSLRENLTMGTTGWDDDDIVHAARIVGVNEFADRHPEGYGMPVGPQGRFLSGGERQAVAVARALLRDGAAFLLDEPTSSFDNTSERRFRMRFSHVLGDKTLLLATNRASMLSLVDRVIVIDGGRIVADGARQDVLEGLQGGLIQALQEAG